MDEILYELKDHITGLNCGRWDYIFSFIKTLNAHQDYVLPDRSQVVMSKAFLAAYSELLIQTCHRRGAFAMGGMAAQIPNRKDALANEAALAKVRADKEREARNGHEGTKTEAGFRENIRVGIQYVEAWLRGRGAVPLYNLMEDAATAEISRTQIWQWLKYGAMLEGGRKVSRDFFERCVAEEMKRLEEDVAAEAFKRGRFPEAIELFRRLSTSERLEAFLTLPAYELIE
jgi:malate synthase